MNSYTRHIQFKGRQIPMVVHEHETFYQCFFSDHNILQDFSGMLQFEKGSTEPTNERKKDQPGAKDLYRAILKEL